MASAPSGSPFPVRAEPPGPGPGRLPRGRHLGERRLPLRLPPPLPPRGSEAAWSKPGSLGGSCVLFCSSPRQRAFTVTFTPCPVTPCSLSSVEPFTVTLAPWTPVRSGTHPRTPAPQWVAGHKVLAASAASVPTRCPSGLPHTRTHTRIFLSGHPGPGTGEIAEILSPSSVGQGQTTAVPGGMAPLEVRVLVVLLLPLGQTAPRDGALRFLQGYLKGLKRMEEEPQHMSWEQVVLCLFALHDYDHSGQLDGLELFSMLTAALAPGAVDSPTTNSVVLVVDEVLATQDLNGDGLMTPAELINFPGEVPWQAGPKEPLAPSPQESQAVEMQPLLAESPTGQETQEFPSPGEEAGGQGEGRRESLESAQEAGGQREAEREAPGLGGEAGGQAEARDTGGEEELLGEMLESENAPNEHTIQVEYDEM
ncbi:cell growth regulator with EF hand domain protein 1 isoform X2 [Choloepus didactylus]|uniref:cell growth regulator with EF hand domain protein 1 isoform X2 n=1 Tax=Choloepus didactylus TaxID=27675 RepID=UPI00189D636A|nr:cell growth regulator with EF hand domain protein 1 isoform X2 [Choloepus didactylus]